MLVMYNCIFSAFTRLLVQALSLCTDRTAHRGGVEV